MKRMHPRGRGRGFMVQKPFSEITVIVRETEVEAAAKKGARKGGGKKAAAASKEAE
jgi:large subunit ribosomal protein L22